MMVNLENQRLLDMEVQILPPALFSKKQKFLIRLYYYKPNERS